MRTQFLHKSNILTQSSSCWFGVVKGLHYVSSAFFFIILLLILICEHTYTVLFLVRLFAILFNDVYIFLSFTIFVAALTIISVLSILPLLRCTFWKFLFVLLLINIPFSYLLHKLFSYIVSPCSPSLLPLFPCNFLAFSLIFLILFTQFPKFLQFHPSTMHENADWE